MGLLEVNVVLVYILMHTPKYISTAGLILVTDVVETLTWIKSLKQRIWPKDFCNRVLDELLQP